VPYVADFVTPVRDVGRERAKRCNFVAMLLAGKCALVTGASRGIGRVIAEELEREGARVAWNWFDEPAPGEFNVQADVANSAEVERMIELVVERFGRIDILVNNAAVQTWKPLLDLQEAEWDRVIATNLKGCFLCTQRAARRMKDQGGGSIINIGSGCNKIAFPRLVDYTASKGGIEMLTKVAAVELGPFGITVNCVAPGAILTERTARETKDYAETWAALTPMGRIGDPIDVASAVVFLSSDAAKFITGQTLGVDGGLMSKPQWPY
jgi:NAD(P)-dependent dehydrogenase (short-subunit alcohol dehydrogenase family)